MDCKLPYHLNAAPSDLSGNDGLGRYIFLTGSDQRAKDISDFFSDVTVLAHPRQHNLYLGTLPGLKKISVASISTGMGGPSADIIINELIMLGARRLLRVGTAGSLQPARVKTGDIVIATAAVRDDKASWDYIYREYPALASPEYLSAAKKVADGYPVHFGIVHSKSSLYAREFACSFLPENKEYMKTMQMAGVLASEMECAQLFVLSSLMSARMPDILCGAVLAVVGDRTAFSDDKQKIAACIEKSMGLSLEITREMAATDAHSLGGNIPPAGGDKTTPF